jgi:F0F1-type ATP synthase alpha subunit
MLLDVPVDKIDDYREKFLEYIGYACPDVLRLVEAKGIFDDEMKETVKKAAQDFTDDYIKGLEQ